MASKFDKPGDVVTPPYKFAHVVLRTNKYEEMVKFYQIFFGAELRFGNEILSLLGYDDEHHRIGIINLHIANKNPMTCGLEHLSFTYRSLDDLALAALQREKHGIKPTWCTNHGPTTSIYYKDPDGNNLETQVDNFETMEEADEFLASEEFKTNPVGVDFTIDELLKRLEAGEDHASIKKRPASGPRDFDDVPEKAR